MLIPIFTCPVCDNKYEPDVFDKNDCKTEMQLEQHLSGTCSNECWDAMFSSANDQEENPQNNELNKRLIYGAFDEEFYE